MKINVTITSIQTYVKKMNFTVGVRKNVLIVLLLMVDIVQNVILKHAQDVKPIFHFGILNKPIVNLVVKHFLTMIVILAILMRKITYGVLLAKPTPIYI